MKKKHSLLFGAHMSIAGEMHLAIERGKSIGCTAIQIFTKSNRQWHAKAITDKEADSFKKAWKESSIQSIIAHASYLINIGSPDSELEKKSVYALELELNRCTMLDIPYLVLHPGSSTKGDEQECLARISQNIDKLLAKIPHCNILLETMAGQGTSVGYTFEHLAQIIKHSEHKKRLGVCFDTCHAFAAGYDFSTEKTYNLMWEQFDKIVGINKIKAFHINDSQKDLGSRVDRHTDIGKGKMGLKAFKLLFNDPTFFDIPKILETPKNDLSDDKKNMDTLFSLLTEKTRTLLHADTINL
ncbi:MAG TPA: deoxyribonuclease IV [Candidatus Babeliales bacterium]|jgi:deoxyribonuclease-4|nr:deoxyribonuclease IV [Candidatus Babeliales bacterium]